MKFFSDIRLLILAVWLGAAVYFVGVAAIVFRMLELQQEQAGAIVSRNLTILNFAGMIAAVLLLVTSTVGSARIGKFWLWVERILLLIIGVACAYGQFVIGFWMESIRSQLGRPTSEVPADDPLRLQFESVHNYSEWTLLAAMVAALIVFFIISNRKFIVPPAEKADDVYDFSNEFKS